MARVIPTRDPTPASLEECIEALTTWGFDPYEEESVSHAANWLQRLGNDAHFLGDALVDLLADRPRHPRTRRVPRNRHPLLRWSCKR